MATKKKSTTTKKTTVASPAVEETPTIAEETKVEEPVMEATPAEEVAVTIPPVEENTIKVDTEAPIVTEAVAEEEKKEEPVTTEEVKEEVKPAPKKTSTSKSKSSSNKYAEEEKKYREMAKEAGIELPAEYKYDESIQLVGGKLTGAEIVRQMIMGNIEIEDFDISRIGPNSYDLILDNVFKTYRPIYQSKNKNDHTMYLDMLKENPFEEFIIPDDGYPLMPGKVYIATTKERTFTSKFQPNIDGRSSVGRLGISIHQTAGFGDIGFDGKWTLEITVAQPIIIYPNVPICQISFFVPAGDTSIQYNGRYQHQTNAETSKFYLK